MQTSEAVTFAERIYAELNAASREDRNLAVMIVDHWLEEQGAGFPDVPLLHERARADASLWAASAQVFELEVYVAAAVMALEKSPLTGRAAKRLAALGFRQMDITDRAAFAAWVEKQNAE